MKELANKDQLLQFVDNMYSELKAKTGKDPDGNMLATFTRYYLRHAKEKKALESFMELLRHPPDRSSRNYQMNWKAIREVFIAKEKKLEKLSTEELAYVLGWLSKLARAKV